MPSRCPLSFNLATLAAVLLVVLAHLTPAAALVAPSHAPSQRPMLWRPSTALPVETPPRSDRTALRYLDQTELPETARGLRDLWARARSIKEHDRRAYFDFAADRSAVVPESLPVAMTFDLVEDDTFPHDGEAPASYSFAFLHQDGAMPDVGSPLRFHAVEPRPALSEPISTEDPSLATVAVPTPSLSVLPVALLARVPSFVALVWADLWAHARAVREEDRRAYFEFLKGQAPGTEATVDAVEGGPAAPRPVVDLAGLHP